MFQNVYWLVVVCPLWFCRKQEVQTEIHLSPYSTTVYMRTGSLNLEVPYCIVGHNFLWVQY